MNGLIGNMQVREQVASQIDYSIINLKRMLDEVEKSIQSGTALSEEYYYFHSLLPKKIAEQMSINNINNWKLKEGLEFGIEEIEKMKADVLNSDMAVNSLVEQLFQSVDENNIEGSLFVQRLKSLIEDGQIIITTSKDDMEACYNPDFNYVSMGSRKYIENGNYTVLAHELGHYFHRQVLDSKMPSNFDEIVSFARTMATDNGTLEKASQVYKEKISKANEQAQSEVNMTLQEKMQEFISLQKYFIQNGVRPITAIKMAKEQIYADRISTNYDRIINDENQLEYTPELADIIDAVFEGKKRDTNGKFFALTRGHGSEYFSTRESQFSEMIADFTALKVTGKKHDLEMLRTMFGNDFYNMLNTTFSHFIKADLVQEQDSVQEYVEVPQQPQIQEEVQEFVEMSETQSPLQQQDLLEQPINYENVSTLSNGRAR